jgi:hypothetical protein
MSAHNGPWILVIATVFAGMGMAACTGAEPRPAATAAPSMESERLSTTDEKTAAVSESTMSAPIARATTAAAAPTTQAEAETETAPAGQLVRQEPIKAERYKARIIIDDPSSDDVAVHKATLVEDRKGKHIQMGDHTHPWTNCN